MAVRSENWIVYWTDGLIEVSTLNSKYLSQAGKRMLATGCQIYQVVNQVSTVTYKGRLVHMKDMDGHFTHFIFQTHSAYGPAIIDGNGFGFAYYLNGVRIHTKELWEKHPIRMQELFDEIISQEPFQ